MLTVELRSNINKKWEACWPISKLRPLVLLDLISYLLFIKKLEERQLIAGKRTETFKNNLTQAKAKDELSWSRFKDMDAQSMHKLFTKEKGVTDLIKDYGHTNLQYSLFIKEPLLLTPTVTLLANMVDIIKIMERQDSDTRAAIFEYLLYKAEIVGQNGQVYAPDYVVKLIVALMQPSSKDVIGDPSAGNGSFLINSEMFIANKNAGSTPNFKNDFATDIYKGIDCDLIQLRIGAMNMILNGIEDPKLKCLNVFSEANLNLREQPTLIFSNLFFEDVENKTTANANTLQTETGRQEIRFLKFILKNLKIGARVAVIIRESILYDNITEIKTVRQQIIDDHNLEAIITLPRKAGSLFSGACILIFTKPETYTTDKVWFYKMESGKKGINKKDADAIHTDKNDVPAFAEEYNDVPDILNRWENKKGETGRMRTDKSFYVSADEIKTNNYNLCFNEYRTIVKEPELYTRNEASVADKKITPAKIIQNHTGLYVIKEKLNILVVPVMRLSAIVLKRLSTINLRRLLTTVLKSLSTINLRRLLTTVLKSLSIINLKRLPTINLKRPSTILLRRYFIIVVSIMVICLVMATFYFYFDNKKDNAISTATKYNASHSKNKQGKYKASRKLSAQQIKAILKDTTGIIHFEKQSDNISTDIKDSKELLDKENNENILVSKKPRKKPGASGNALKVQYAVINTTFFHDQPDKSTRRKSYLDPLNNNVLNPIDDRNGFIYIVYTNRFGRTSKGWINKKDLKSLP